MRLKAYLYCNKCGKDAVHEWVGVGKDGYWEFRCIECGNEQYFAPWIGWIEWLDEEEEAEKKWR